MTYFTAIMPAPDRSAPRRTGALVRLSMALALGAMCLPNAQASCHAALKGRLPRAGTVIFGEVHGTREIPAFFSRCVRDFIARGEAVRVFLEFPQEDSPHTARYLRGEIDEAALLASPHWTRQDGRSSQAMLALHRDLKGASVFGFAPGAGTYDYEEAMGRAFLQQHLADGYNFVLVGNVHARLAAGKVFSYRSVPFGQYLRDRLGNVVSLEARFTAGSAWVCAAYCESTRLGGNEPACATPAGRIGFVHRDRGYTGYFSVGAISASPPARDFTSR